MKKSLIIINVLALFLTSCGNFVGTPSQRGPATANTDRPCTDLVKDFFTKTNDLSLKTSLKMELTKAQTDDFFKEFGEFNLSKEQSETLRAIFLFSRDEHSIRKNLLKEYHNEIDGKGIDATNKTWEKFASHKKRVEIQKQKFLAKEKTEAGKAGALEKSMIYEKLYYSCKTQIQGKPTASDLKQAKRLTYALTAGSIGSGAVTYTAVHWEEDKNSKWFNELYFTLGIGLVLSYVNGKFVFANPSLNPWLAKMPLAFASNSVSDIEVSALYSYIFSTGDKEFEKKLEALQADPEAQEKLQALLKVAEDHHLFEKHLKNTQDLFKDKKTNVSMDSKEITFDDIDLDASRELLMAALAEQEYLAKTGMLEMGSPAVDRYTFHRLYNLLSVPTNIGLTILMNNQLCMTADPKKGFAKAVGMYMATSILFDALYFKSRKEVINQ